MALHSLKFNSQIQSNIEYKVSLQTFCVYVKCMCGKKYIQTSDQCANECGNQNMLYVTTDFEQHEKELLNISFSSSYRLVHASLCENSISVLK